MSASAAYRLSTVHRGAQGFEEFATDEIGAEPHPPIYIYDRLDEPTRGMLEDHLAEAEGGDMAVCFASGMAAISAAIGVTTQAGDEIVAHHTLYGCTYSLFTTWLPRFGVNVRFADLRDEASVAQAITDRTRVVYGETPVNPTLDLIDVDQVKQWINAINDSRSPAEQMVWIVDNTFATPYCQRPLQHGADLVVQSLTKDIGGFGGVLSPKSAWPILVYGYHLGRQLGADPHPD
jgi:cystathionine beta-lyase/cystathionine gamma-synthase